MLRFNSLRELGELLPKEVRGEIADLLLEYESYFDGKSLEDVSFTDLLGGAVFLVEAVEDLHQVRSFEEGPRGRLSILERASGWFDIAEWVKGGGFARFASVDCADGGAQYFIPVRVAHEVPSVAESIRMKGSHN